MPEDVSANLLGREAGSPLAVAPRTPPAYGWLVSGAGPGATCRPRTTAAYGWLIVAIMVAAALLRFVALDRYPLPVHQDELTDVYDGYGLWTTGADRFGDRWPAILRGMGPGDYHPGLYAYLAMISTGLAGFSVWAGRLPAALAGVLTVWLVYLTARRGLGPRVAVLALLFAALSPIHVLYSRQSHTGLCVQPMFAILMLYLLVRTLDAVRRAPDHSSSLMWVAVTGFVVGFSTNAYGAMRLSALLFVVLVGVSLTIAVGFKQRAVKRLVAALVVLALTAGVGAAPQIHAMVTRPDEFFARASTVVFPLEYGPRWWLGTLAKNILANLDPHFLFFSFGEYRDMTVVRLGVASLPFLYIGFVFALVKGRWAWGLLLLASVAIFLLPAVVSKPNPNAMRSSGVWALYPLVSAVGAAGLGGLIQWLLVWLRRDVAQRGLKNAMLPSSRGVSRFSTAATGGGRYMSSRPAPAATGGGRYIPQEPATGQGWPSLEDDANGTHDNNASYRMESSSMWLSRANYVSVALGLVIVAVGLFNVVRYVQREDLHGAGRQNRLVRLGEWLGEHGAGYDRIYVDTDGLFPYFYLAVFSGMTPAEFQQTTREGTVTKYGWEHFHRFGRFRFATADRAEADWAASAQDETWLVVRGDGSHIELAAESHVAPARSKPGDVHMAVDSQPQN